MSTFSDLMLSRVPVNSPVHTLVHQELVLCFPRGGVETQANTTRVVRATATGLGRGQDGVGGGRLCSPQSSCPCTSSDTRCHQEKPGLPGVLEEVTALPGLPGVLEKVTAPPGVQRVLEEVTAPPGVPGVLEEVTAPLGVQRVLEEVTAPPGVPGVLEEVTAPLGVQRVLEEVMAPPGVPGDQWSRQHGAQWPCMAAGYSRDKQWGGWMRQGQSGWKGLAGRLGWAAWRGVWAGQGYLGVGSAPPS